MMELVYTSAPKGLFSGQFGFCTVGATGGMPHPLIQRLESLSGYRPLHKAGDPRSGQNPVSYTHSLLRQGGQTYSVLSAVRMAGADYTGRTNKLAHHLVLEPAERVFAGPAWCLRQEGVMRQDWDGPPRQLPAPSPLPRGHREGGICEAWAELTGDAGWAGVLVDTFLLDPDRPAYVLYEPGMDVLQLIDEAIALLPVERRWDVTFNTFFEQLPAGQVFSWRCCVAGTTAARDATRYATSGVVIDLTKAPLPLDRDSRYIRKARTGVAEEPAAEAVTSLSKTPVVEVETAANAPAARETTATRPTQPQPSKAAVAPTRAPSGRRQLLWGVLVVAAVIALAAALPHAMNSADAERLDPQTQDAAAPQPAVADEQATANAHPAPIAPAPAAVEQDPQPPATPAPAADHGAHVRELQRELASTHQHVGQLEARLRDTQQSAQAAGQELQTLRSQHQALEAQNTKLRTERDELVNRLARASEPLRVNATLLPIDDAAAATIPQGADLDRMSWELPAAAERLGFRVGGDDNLQIQQRVRGNFGDERHVPVAALQSSGDNLILNWHTQDREARRALLDVMRYAALRGETRGQPVVVQFTQEIQVNLPVGDRRSLLNSTAAGVLPPMVLRVTNPPAGWQVDERQPGLVNFGRSDTTIELALSAGSGVLTARWLSGSPQELQAAIAKAQAKLDDLAADQKKIVEWIESDSASPSPDKSKFSHYSDLAESIAAQRQAVPNVAALQAQLEAARAFSANVLVETADTAVRLATVRVATPPAGTEAQR